MPRVKTPVSLFPGSLKQLECREEIIDTLVVIFFTSLLFS